MNDNQPKQPISGGEHYLVEIRPPSPELVQLREELGKHSDIVAYAIQGQTIEDCLGRIALKLDIALDGDYDLGPLCGMLVSALKQRHQFADTPHKRVPGLVAAEIIETEDGIHLEKVEKNAKPRTSKSDLVVTRVDHSARQERRDDTGHLEENQQGSGSVEGSSEVTGE